MLLPFQEQNKLRMFGYVSVVQFLSHVQLSAIPWAATCQASLASSVAHSLPKFMCIESVMRAKRLV